MSHLSTMESSLSHDSVLDCTHLDDNSSGFLDETDATLKNDHVRVDQLFDDARSERSGQGQSIKDSGYGDIQGADKLGLDPLNEYESSDPPTYTEDVSLEGYTDLGDILDAVRLDNGGDCYHECAEDSRFAELSSLSRGFDGEGFVDCMGDEGDFHLASDAFQGDSMWDDLLNHGSDGTVSQAKVPINCRPSMFVRFDPLYKKQILDPVMDECYTGADLVQHSGPVSGAQHDPTDGALEDLIEMSTPTKKQHTTTTATSKTSRHPAARRLEEIAHSEGVDRLLSMTPEEDARKSVTDDMTVGAQDIVEVLKYSQLDMNRITKDMELKWNSRLLASEKEHAKEMKDLQKKYSLLERRLGDSEKARDSMKLLMGEYEKTVQHVVADKEKISSESHETMATVRQERDQAVEDVHTLEAAFSDLHRRYDKAKSILEIQKRNEDSLKEAMRNLQAQLRASEEKCERVIKQAEEKLDQANIQIDKMKKISATESARMAAEVKKKNLEIQSLQTNYDQKVQESKELMAICDELIAKVGDS